MYSLDVLEARKADTTGGQIKEIGKYVGTITQAEDITAKTGTKGITLAFTANSGQKAKLTMYTMKADGTKIGGFSTLSALMTCLQLRNIAPKAGKVTRYDFDAKQDVVGEGSVFHELCKPIGILLETEDFAKQDGSTGTRMVLKGVFQANTELTASEILDRKTVPSALPKMVAALRHHPLKAMRPMPERTPSQQGGVYESGFNDDMDGEIPFATASMHYDMTTSKQRRMLRHDY